MANHEKDFFGEELMTHEHKAVDYRSLARHAQPEDPPKYHLFFREEGSRAPRVTVKTVDTMEEAQAIVVSLHRNGTPVNFVVYGHLSIPQVEQQVTYDVKFGKLASR